MKKFVTVLAAALMLCAVPSVALAVESPSSATVTDTQSGVVLSVTSGADCVDTIAETSTPAKNVPAGVTPLASFDVEGTVPEGQTVTLTFSVGQKYAGYAVTIYIEHSDGTTEVQEGTVSANGTVSVTVSKLSTFSIVLGEAPTAESGSNSVDTSSTSPKTDASLLPAIAMTATSVMGAGAAAVAIRRKVK